MVVRALPRPSRPGIRHARENSARNAQRIRRQRRDPADALRVRRLRRNTTHRRSNDSRIRHQAAQGQTIALIAHDDDYGTANASTIRAVAARLGAEVVAAEMISPRITDVTAPLLNVAPQTPTSSVNGVPGTGGAGRAEICGIRHDEIPLAQAIREYPYRRHSRKTSAMTRRSKISTMARRSTI